METNKSSIGSTIATVIIIAIIILGGLYFWGKRIEESKLKKDLITDSKPETMDESANLIYSVSAGDDLDSIETDLNATNLNNLGTELQ